MPYLMPTPVRCPLCGQQFTAQLEQIVDVGAEPAGRERLLSGRLNAATCPRCGKASAFATPLLYHEPAHELLLIHVPVELNLPQPQREALIGSLTRTLMSRLPAEGRKGYLFNPQTVLTREGLVDRVLRAGGVPAEVLEEQRKRSRLLARLVAASDAEIEPLVKANDDEVDELLFQLLAATIDSARQAGREDEAERLTGLRNRLLSLASWSRERGITPERLDEQQVRIELVEQFLSAEESEWPELARKHNQQLDYLFFQLLTALAEGARDEQATQMRKLRDRLAELTTVGRDLKEGKEALEGLESAADSAGGLSRELLLEQIIEADGDAAVEALALAGSLVLDYSFFILMADKIEAAEKKGDHKEAGRLSALREKLVSLTESWQEASRARAEQVSHQIEELLAAEEQDAAIERLLPQVDEFFLSLLGSRIEMAAKAEQQDTGGRLEQLFQKIVAQLQASAPPEIRLINELMELEDDDAVRQELERRRGELTPAVAGLIEEMLGDMRSRGQESIAGRLETVANLVKSCLSEGAGGRGSE